MIKRLRITKNTIEVLDNLKATINKAGGNIDLNRVYDMTVLEFISYVCVPNNIRFIFNKCDFYNSCSEEECSSCQHNKKPPVYGKYFHFM